MRLYIGDGSICLADCRQAVIAAPRLARVSRQRVTGCINAAVAARIVACMLVGPAGNSAFIDTGF